MNSIIQNNPFSIYDFLGYLFPGIFFVIIMAILITTDTLCAGHLLNSICEDNCVLENITTSNVLFFIILSYIAGHLLSYISSLTIERLSLWLYGYPSEFLLGQRKNIGFWESCVTTSGTAEGFNCNNCRCCVLSCVVTMLIRLIICSLTFPIIFLTMLGRIVNIKGFIIKPLDKLTCDLIYERIKGIGNKLGFTIPNYAVDYSRIAYHYYIHAQNTIFMQKVNNYVALYGFLRVITLILNITTMFVMIDSFFKGVIVANAWFIVVLMFVTYVSFLAYIKFYRRYTLEIFMFLVSDKDLVINQHDHLSTLNISFQVKI